MHLWLIYNIYSYINKPVARTHQICARRYLLSLCHTLRHDHKAIHIFLVHPIKRVLYNILSLS